MKNIVTITLNPTIDKSTTVPALVPEKKLQCTPPKFEPGGGGINVSRAVKKLGGDSTAIYLAGGYSGNFLQSLLEEEDIDTIVVTISNHTRENMIVVDETTNLQYRFGMPGARVQEKEWRECLNLLKDNSGYNYAVISGSNAPGVPVDFYIEAAEIIKQKSARLIMDTSGDALKNALENGVFLIKPNLGELSSLYGVEELHPHEVIEAARSFIARGSCEVMVVSMGAGGALLVTKNEHHYVVAPAIKRKSTVGAGDSMVAGILMALNNQWNWKQVLQYGVAAGTAATMNAGTELCKKQDTDRIYKHLQH